MRKATHISSFLFNCQLITKSECSGVALFESSLTLSASAKASYVSTSSSTGPGGQSGLHEGIHVNLQFPLVAQPRILISTNAASHRAFNYGQAKKRSPLPQLKGPPWWG